MSPQIILDDNNEHGALRQLNLSSSISELSFRIRLDSLALSVIASLVLRSRIVLGVTSMHSSTAINSRACSREKILGGVKRIGLSDAAARTLVIFFSFVMLTFMSSSREFSPTIIPS